MIPEIRNHSYHHRIQDLDFISLVQRRLRGQLIEVFKHMIRCNTESARGLFDYYLNDKTRNNGAKLILKHFGTSVTQHFYPITILVTPCSMVWNWRVSRAGPMPFYWPSCSLPFCLLLFSLSLLSFYGWVLWGWGLRTDGVLIALSQPCIANLIL